MLTCARWSPSSCLGHRNLDNLVERITGMASEQASQSRCHPCPDDDRNVLSGRRSIEIEQVPDVLERIAERYHAHTSSYRLSGDDPVATGRCCQDEDTRLAEQVTSRAMSDHPTRSALSAQGNGSINCLLSNVMHVNSATGRLEKRTNHVGAGGPQADNGDVVRKSVVQCRCISQSRVVRA